MKRWLLLLVAIAASGGCFVTRIYNPAGREVYFVVPGVGEFLVHSDMPNEAFYKTVDGSRAASGGTPPAERPLESNEAVATPPDAKNPSGSD
ncbi:MAG TPA: hypothetical protein VMF30_00250 [Pirellulales bacterium]|nr:hypothetical protein [Pirellulales bacterium]